MKVTESPVVIKDLSVPLKAISSEVVNADCGPGVPPPGLLWRSR